MTNITNQLADALRALIDRIENGTGADNRGRGRSVGDVIAEDCAAALAAYDAQALIAKDKG